MARESKYTGFGYWAVQIGFSALFTILGLGGGVYILIDISRPDYSGTASIGDGFMVLLTGILFLLLLIWLITSLTGRSREQRAIYAWAIMQDYTARNPGSRPLRPRKTVAADLASLGIAERAASGELDLDEVLRLQALRPDVPYPGDLAELRRRSAARQASLLTPEQRELRRSQWEADDAEARAALDAAGLGRRHRAERILRRIASVTGWAALGCFLLFAWTQLPIFSIGKVMALIGTWCVLRVTTGIMQDARIRRGLAIVEQWRADPERVRRGLPAPYDEYVGTPVGGWWMRLMTPMMIVGLLFLLGGAANIGAAEASDERSFYIGLAAVAFALFLASIALRIIAGRRASRARDRRDADRGPRVPPTHGSASPRSTP